MSQIDLTRFRRMCAQFRWLALFMVVAVGAVLLLQFSVGIFLGLPSGKAAPGLLTSAVWNIPSVIYLFAVWSIGRAMGDLSKGRLFQPTVADALRRVGLALGVGGVFSVFIMSNLLRIIGETRGGYLHFDVAGMTLGMIGGALFLLGRVVDQASRVQGELDAMI